MENSIDIVWNYISNLKSALENKNRIFTNDHFEFIEHLRWIFSNKTEIIKSNKILYRGRIYTDIDKWDKYHHPENYKNLEYAGYNKEDSFVNINNHWPQDGRMNPPGIFALYTSKDPNTCIKELSPGYAELISIAEIKVLEDLKIANLSKGFAIGDYSEKFRVDLSLYLQELISQGGYNSRDYIFPQFIAEACKYLGYDGIAYRSKYETRTNVANDIGINVTIFNYNKCAPINSKLYRVDEVLIRSTEL